MVEKTREMERSGGLLLERSAEDALDSEALRRACAALARQRVGMMSAYDGATEEALRRAVRDAFGAEQGVRVGRRASARYERLREAMRRGSAGDASRELESSADDRSGRLLSAGSSATRMVEGSADALATWDDDIEWAVRLSKRKLRRVEQSLVSAQEERAEVNDVTVKYDELDAAVYAVMRSPMTMGALKRIFYETRDRLGESFSPKTVLDFGSGPMPTTLFALRAVFGDNVGTPMSANPRDGEIQVAFVDSNPGMMRFARRVVGYAKNVEAEREAEAMTAIIQERDDIRPRQDTNIEGIDQLDFTEFEDADEKSALSAPRPASALRLKTPHPWHESEGVRTSASLRGANRRGGFDVVVSSYALLEIPDEATARNQQRQVDVTIRQLWDKVALGGILVLAEPGTPKGSLLVRRARAMILDVARRDMEQRARRLGIEPSEEDVDAYVVAPCQHDGACPVKESNREDGFSTWCHFPQRSMRSEYMREMKHGLKTYQDEKFSYVVVRKSSRASARADASRAAREARRERTKKPSAATDDDDDDDEAFHRELARDSMQRWGRVIRHPIRRKGHVVFELCAPTGELERVTVAKSHGREIGRDGYKFARKLHWGDLYPFERKLIARPGDQARRELAAARREFDALTETQRANLRRSLDAIDGSFLDDDDDEEEDDDEDEDDHHDGLSRAFETSSPSSRPDGRPVPPRSALR